MKDVKTEIYKGRKIYLLIYQNNTEMKFETIPFIFNNAGTRIKDLRTDKIYDSDSIEDKEFCENLCEGFELFYKNFDEDSVKYWWSIRETMDFIKKEIINLSIGNKSARNVFDSWCFKDKYTMDEINQMREDVKELFEAEMKQDYEDKYEYKKEKWLTCDKYMSDDLYEF